MRSLSKVAVESFWDEMEKIAVPEFLWATDRPALRVARPPSKLRYYDAPQLTLENLPAETLRRYPKLRSAREFAGAVETMNRRLREVGVLPGGAAVTMGPEEGSWASGRPGENRVGVGSWGPFTVTHEMGHVADSPKGEGYFGDRGFFGLGGSTKSQVPSEVSATTQAFQALPNLSAREKAHGLTATGTYLEGAALEGKKGGKVKKLRAAYDAAVRAAGERAGLVTPAAREARVAEIRNRIHEKLEPIEKARKRRSDLWEQRAEKAKNKAQQLRQSLGMHGFGTPEENLDWMARDEGWDLYDKVEDAYRAGERARAPTREGTRRLARMRLRKEMDPEKIERLKRLEAFAHKYRMGDWDLPLEERYSKRHLPLLRASQRDFEPRVADIFTDPLYEKMTPKEQKAVQRYVESYGKRIGKHFGGQNQKLYMDEVGKAMRSPTLRRLAHLGKGIL